jgi:hypothetical protein
VIESILKKIASPRIRREAIFFAVFVFDFLAWRGVACRAWRA